MEIPCENSTTNQTILSEARRLSHYVTPGCWAILFISIHGVISNIVLMRLAYRRRWHHCVHYTLIIHQAIVDLLAALSMVAVSLFELISWYSPEPFILNQIACMWMFIPPAILLTYGQRSSLVVALDRLINVTRPYQWVRLGVTYRLIMLSIALVWVLVQELGWLAFIRDDRTCVLVCYSYGSYVIAPQWSDVVTIGDTCAAAAIVLVYAALPTLSGSIFRHLLGGCRRYLIVALDQMEERQQRMVRNVRRLSMLTVTSFLLTTFVGFLACDLTSDFFTDDETLLILQTFGDALSTLNTVLPLYLYLWREKVFGKLQTL